ncbi:hypothetical protein Bca101_063408 [Brassica carinata]
MVKYLSMISAIKWKKRLSTKATRRARGGRRRRRGDFVAPEIPFDLMIEILKRLPAKSLMRFRCVSKLWSCLIRSRYFSNIYLKFASSASRLQPLGIYMSWVENYNGDYSLELCEIPKELQLISLRLSSSSAESSLEPELTFPGIGGHNMVVLRGLILYSLCRKACIYNPTTRQSLILPAIKSNILAQKEPKYVHYFFGHDPVHDHYKIVCTIVMHPLVRGKITSEHWVFVLEPGGFWKKVEYDDQPHMPTKKGLCVNGVIYYLALTHTCRDNVYCFDVRSEEFSKIQAPHEVSEFGEWLGFIEHGGKPAIFDYTHIIETGVSELWVLEVDSGTWSRKSLVLKPCQRHLVDGINVTKLRVYGTGQNNNEVILALIWPRYLLYYDLIKNDLRKVNINIEITPVEHLFLYVTVMDKNTKSGNFTKINAGVNFIKDDLIASLTLNDKGDSINASYYHIVNPLFNTSVGAEVNHKFSNKVNTITVGTQHSIDPLTMVKARVNSAGIANALIQHEWSPRSFFTISGEVDTKAIDKSAKVGLALSLKP